MSDDEPEPERALLDAETLRGWVRRWLDTTGERPAVLTMRLGERVDISPELHKRVKPGRRHGEWLVPTDL